MDEEMKLLLHDNNNTMLEVVGRLEQLTKAINKLIVVQKKIASKLDESK